MNGIRMIRVLSAAVVAAIAAWASYWHMVHVALRFGERSEVAYVLPLSVDGVLTVAAIVMADDRRARHPVRPIAKVAFLIGLCASIAANVAAAQPTLGGRLVAAWPAVALFLIVEMLVFIRTDPPPESAENDPARLQAIAAPPPVRRVAANGAPGREEPAPDVPGKFRPEPHRNLHPEPHRANGTARRRRPTSITRQLAADLLVDEPDLTREEIAARIGISTRRLRAVLSSPPPT